MFFFFQAEDGIRDRSPSRGLGDVYKRQYVYNRYITVKAAGKGTVTYSSTNKNIAIVNSKSGLVRTKKPGRVQIKITVSGNSNYNKASGIVTLIVTPAKSSITKLASNSSRSLKVTYKKVSGATGYQITYATNKSFKSAKTKYVSAKYGSATCLLYTSPSPRDGLLSRMPSSA